MARRVVAIINPLAGRGSAVTLVAGLRGSLQTRGVLLDAWMTAAQGHAAELASQVDHGVEALLVVGGDGTVSEVVNGLAETGVPIVVLPTGTENLLARELHMPTRRPPPTAVDRWAQVLRGAGPGPEEIAAALLDGESFFCDVGVIATGSTGSSTCGRHAERKFVVVAGFGFDAEVAARLALAGRRRSPLENRISADPVGRLSRRRPITRVDYFWPAWRTFWSHRFPVLRVEVDGTCVFEDRGLVIVGIIGRHAGGLRLLAHARFDDGLLDVCVLPCTTRRGLLGHASRLALRRHIGHGGTLYYQARCVRISSPDEVPIEVDGDIDGVLPAEVSILAGAVRFRHLKVPSRKRRP